MSVLIESKMEGGERKDQHDGKECPNCNQNDCNTSDSIYSRIRGSGEKEKHFKHITKMFFYNKQRIFLYDS